MGDAQRDRRMRPRATAQNPIHAGIGAAVSEHLEVARRRRARGPLPDVAGHVEHAVGARAVGEGADRRREAIAVAGIGAARRAPVVREPRVIAAAPWEAAPRVAPRRLLPLLFGREPSSHELAVPSSLVPADRDDRQRVGAEPRIGVGDARRDAAPGGHAAPPRRLGHLRAIDPERAQVDSARRELVREALARAPLGDRELVLVLTKLDREREIALRRAHGERTLGDPHDRRALDAHVGVERRERARAELRPRPGAGAEEGSHKEQAGEPDPHRAIVYITPSPRARPPPDPSRPRAPAPPRPECDPCGSRCAGRLAGGQAHRRRRDRSATSVSSMARNATGISGSIAAPAPAA